MIENANRILSFGARTALGSGQVLCNGAGEILLDLLKRNETYCEKDQNPAHLTDLVRKDTAEHGQHPKAAVLCCADSRVPPEHIFSAGIGELFVIRNAGNLLGSFALGSLEYAAEHLGTELVVLMGHRNCGAVASALAGARENGSLGTILDEVSLAIGTERDPRAAEQRNLLHSAARLQDSAILQELHAHGRVEVALCIYDIRTGRVDFLQDEA